MVSSMFFMMLYTILFEKISMGNPNVCGISRLSNDYSVKKTSEKKKLHSDKSTSDSCQINRNQIVFTIFWLIWNQTDVPMVPNQSEKW